MSHDHVYVCPICDVDWRIMKDCACEAGYMTNKLCPECKEKGEE
jgi:hypothetical protein